MEIRKANESDISRLIENRMEFITTIKNVENIEEFKISTKKYFEEHIHDDSFLAYIAIHDDKIVASCIMCIYQTIPLVRCLNGKNALLFNVYTVKEYRRQGFASKLINHLMAEAKQLGVGKITLDFTEDGYFLYQSLGFEKSERQMVQYLIP